MRPFGQIIPHQISVNGVFVSVNFHEIVDCKTVLFFANASDGQYSNERSGASLKAARENGERR